jgi:hypothetical protein
MSNESSAGEIRKSSKKINRRGVMKRNGYHERKQSASIMAMKMKIMSMAYQWQ